MTIKIQNIPVIYDDETARVADGSTAERPESPEVGMIRFNTDIDKFEGYDGIEWVDLSEPFPDRIAYAWGRGSFGQLGTGNNVTQSSPVNVVGGITNWSQVSVGAFHSLGVTRDSIAYAWGSGFYGRLGDGTRVNRSSPVVLAGGITNWSQVSAGSGHSLGVTRDGIAYAWGNGSNGKLGTGVGGFPGPQISSPVTVVGGITNWSQVSAGGQHSLGVTGDGIAYAWGSGSLGRLGTGNGVNVNQSSPVAVVGGITNWSQVSAGGFHSVGVTQDGIAYAWGFGVNGQLGDGTTTNKSSPVTVVGGITNWSQVSAGDGHSLGLTQDGIAYAWGLGSLGQLGVDTGQIGTEPLIDRSSPVTVVGGITNWSQVSAGGAGHSLGVTDSGVAYAWGNNDQGRLGDGTTADRSSPVTVVGGITNWSQVSAGGQHNIGLLFVE